MFEISGAEHQIPLKTLLADYYDPLNDFEKEDSTYPALDSY
jgi:hypothetical protein